MNFGINTFANLCVKELELCGLKPGEVMAVLTQGTEKLDYADAMLAAGEQLGASTLHIRLPQASTSLSGDTGQWTVGATPLASNRAAVAP